jgi:hypothetical protein
MKFCEYDEAKACMEKTLRIKKEYLVEHHPEIVKVYFSLMNCIIWERGNMEKQK